jgi:hypothetical protein
MSVEDGVMPADILSPKPERRQKSSILEIT